MRPYGSEFTKSDKYCLMYEKDHQYNIGIRTHKCNCNNCRSNFKGIKRGKQYRTYRLNIKNAMRSLKKKFRQYNKQLTK